MLAKISQLIFANTGFHFVPIGSYRDARQVAGCLSDLYLRALRVLRGSNLAFLCALFASVVNFQLGLLGPQDNKVVITDITVYFREKENQNQRHEVCLKYIGLKCWSVGDCGMRNSDCGLRIWGGIGHRA